MELESFKFERFCLSREEPGEVGKFLPKLERTAAVWKFLLKLDSWNELGEFLAENKQSFSLVKPFQRHQWLFNFGCIFQLRPELSNFFISNFRSKFSTPRSFQLNFPTIHIPFLSMIICKWWINDSYIMTDFIFRVEALKTIQPQSLIFTNLFFQMEQ